MWTCMGPRVAFNSYWCKLCSIFAYYILSSSAPRLACPLRYHVPSGYLGLETVLDASDAGGSKQHVHTIGFVIGTTGPRTSKRMGTINGASALVVDHKHAY